MRVYVDNGKGQGSWGESLAIVKDEWKSNFGSGKPIRAALTHCGHVFWTGGFPGWAALGLMLESAVGATGADAKERAVAEEERRALRSLPVE